MKKSVIHITFLFVLAALIALGIAYPFLQGKYDSLAMPLSTLFQLVGVIGLPFVSVGFLWLMFPKKSYLFAQISLVLGIIISLILTAFGFLSIGISLGLIILLVTVYVLILIKPKLKQIKEQNEFNFTPLYMIIVPVASLVFQLAFASTLTLKSKNRAIKNANELIDQLETYKSQRNKYPISLQAQWKDYYPDVAGVEKYHYMPQDDGYNLSFEQPKFFLDNIGTREWVVYNPTGNNKAYSHTSWFLLLSEQELETAQGWYASGETGQPNWKYFLFD